MKLPCFTTLFIITTQLFIYSTNLSGIQNVNLSISLVCSFARSDQINTARSRSCECECDMTRGPLESATIITTVRERSNNVTRNAQ